MSVEADLQHHARLLVRAGFHDPADLLAEVVSGIEAELPGIDASVLARAWIAGATADLRRAAASWPTPTDHERLQAAFEECEEHDVVVLEGSTTATRASRGVITYAEADVWRAIETGVLTLGVQGEVSAAVASCLERHGLPTRTTAGGVDVRTWWQRRQALG